MPPERNRRATGAASVETVPLAEAAQRLGISYDAARHRVKAGTLLAEKRGGRWYASVPKAERPPEKKPDGSGPEPDATIARLEAEITFLRETLTAEIEARRRADHLVAGLMERLPELTTGDAPRTQSLPPLRDEGVARASPPLTMMAQSPETLDAGALAPGWRRWWRRITGT
jgi:hypothetical protein